MQHVQFRGYFFSSNPSVITLEQKNRVLAHFCPGKGDLLENLGAMADRIICKGVFWSQSATETSQQIDLFLETTKNQERGLLFLPFGAPRYCYLKEYVIEGQGDGRIVPYTLVFVAAGEASHG